MDCAAANDPPFERIKDENGILGNAFRLPDEWLLEAKSAISIFCPFSERTRKSNWDNLGAPSEEWLPNRRADARERKGFQACWSYLEEAKIRFKPRCGCGKCQHLVPCETGIQTLGAHERHARRCSPALYNGVMTTPLDRPLDGGIMDHTSDMKGNRAIFADPNTGVLLTRDSATGKLMPITDSETGKPMTKRPLFIDPNTGRYCAADMATGKVSWLIDPATGQPMIISELHEEPETPSGKEALELDERALAAADRDDGPDIAQREDPATAQRDDPRFDQQDCSQEAGFNQANQAFGLTQGPEQDRETEHEREHEHIQAPEPEQAQERNHAAPETGTIEEMKAEISRLRAQLDAQSHVHASGAAVAALVLGILSALTCFMPIVNYASGVLAIIGLIMAIASLPGIRKGKTHGKGFAAAGIILGVLAIAVVVGTQFIYGRIIADITQSIRFEPVAFDALVHWLFGRA